MYILLHLYLLNPNKLAFETHYYMYITLKQNTKLSFLVNLFNNVGWAAKFNNLHVSTFLCDTNKLILS